MLQQLIVTISLPCSSWGCWSPWFFTSALKSQMRVDLPDDPLAIFSDGRKQGGVGRYTCQAGLDHNFNSGTKDLIRSVTQVSLWQVLWSYGVIRMTTVLTWMMYMTGTSHGAILASGSHTDLGKISTASTRTTPVIPSFSSPQGSVSFGPFVSFSFRIPPVGLVSDFLGAQVVDLVDSGKLELQPDRLFPSQEFSLQVFRNFRFSPLPLHSLFTHLRQAPF